jgi:hypothetical protein
MQIMKKAPTSGDVSASFSEWRRWDSNPRPLDCQSNAKRSSYLHKILAFNYLKNRAHPQLISETAKMCHYENQKGISPESNEML